MAETAEVRYRIGRVGGPATRRRALNEAQMLRTLDSILASRPGEWEIRKVGRAEWSPPRRARRIASRLTDLLTAAEVGEAWRFRPVARPGALYVVRVIEVAPAVAPTTGTPAIRTIHEHYFRRFPDHESWGIFNCRRIAGSSTYSQHAWANAEDLSDDGVASEEAERWLFANRTRLPIAELIGRRKIWTRGSEGWRALSPKANQHLDHWHVSAHSLQTGDPPCAG